MNAIMRMRQEKGITQAALAEAAGVSQPFIYDLERGHRGAKMETLEKIADVLGCSVSELYDDERFKREDN